MNAALGLPRLEVADAIGRRRLYELSDQGPERDGLVWLLHPDAPFYRVQISDGAGLEVMAGFILGFDQDDARVFEAQRAFIQSAPIPIAMAGLLTLINHDYMRPLYTTRAGHLLIAVGVAMMTAGALILRRMVKPRTIA